MRIISILFEEQRSEYLINLFLQITNLEPELCHCLRVEGNEKIVVFLIKILLLIYTEVKTLLFSSNDQCLDLLEADSSLRYKLSQFQVKKDYFFFDMWLKILSVGKLRASLLTNWLFLHCSIAQYLTSPNLSGY